MSDGGPLSAAARLDQALARAEAAARAIAENQRVLGKNNQHLREKLTGAIATLDGIINQRPQG